MNQSYDTLMSILTSDRAGHGWQGELFGGILEHHLSGPVKTRDSADTDGRMASSEKRIRADK